MLCRIYFPSAILRPVISHYQIIELDNSSSSLPCTIPAGTCTLTIMLNDCAPDFYCGGEEVSPGQIFLSGYLLKARHLKSKGKIRCLMVVFHPFGAGMVFQISQKEIIDRFVSLNSVIGERANSLLMALKNIRQGNLIVRRFEQFAIDLWTGITYEKSVCSEAISLIVNSKGNIRVEVITDQLHVSSRKLDRQFLKLLGVTPKQYIWMTRLHNAYLMMMQENNCSMFDIVVQLGYYDQAHFINDLRKYAEETPLELMHDFSQPITFKYPQLSVC